MTAIHIPSGWGLSMIGKLANSAPLYTAAGLFRGDEANAAVIRKLAHVCVQPLSEVPAGRFVSVELTGDAIRGLAGMLREYPDGGCWKWSRSGRLTVPDDPPWHDHAACGWWRSGP